MPNRFNTNPSSFWIHPPTFEPASGNANRIADDEEEFDDDTDFGSSSLRRGLELLRADSAGIRNSFTNSNNTMELNKEQLKVRHLSREERQLFHKPKPDWVETPAGEVCKSASTLVVDDLIIKVK